MALKELDALAQAVPGLNQKAAKQGQAAQRIQARSAVGKAAPGQPPAQIAQQVGAPLMAAQQQLGQQAQGQTQQAQLGIAGQQGAQQAFQGQQQLANQGLQQQRQLGDATTQLQLGEAAAEGKLKRKITDKELKQAERLQQLGIEQDNKILQTDIQVRKNLQRVGNDLEDKLFESRRRFEQDELGRKFTNQRQLVDAAILSAKDDIDLQDKLRTISQTAKKKELLLQQANRVLVQKLQADGQRAVQKLSADARRAVAEEAMKSKKAIARAKANSAATGNLIEGAFMIGGAVAGTLLAGPGGTMAGAAAGAALGAGAGKVASGAYQSNQAE